MAVIGSLSVKLGLVTVEWDQATAKAKQQAKDLRLAFNDLTGNVKELGNRFKELGGAFGLGAVGLGALTSSTLSFANDVNDVAKSFDLSTAKVLQFRDALQTSGGKAENASKALSTLFSKIEDARKGNESSIADFERLGLTFEDLNRANPEDALDKVFVGLSKIGNTYERVKMTKEMLGKGGIGVSVEEVADKLGMSTAEYEKNAAAIEHLGEVSDNLKSSMDNLKLAFAGILSPFVGDGLVKMETFKTIMITLGSTALASKLFDFVKVMIEIRKATSEATIAFAALQAVGGGWTLGILAVGYEVLTQMNMITDRAKQLEEMQNKYKPAEQPVAMASGAGTYGLYGPQIADTGLNFAEGGFTKKDDGENKPVEQRPEIIAARAKLAMMQKEIGYSKQLGQIKVESLTTDKMTTALAEEQVKLNQALSAAQAQYVQETSKEKISQEEINVAKSKLALAEQKARTDAKAATDYIIAQHKQEIVLAKQKAGFDKVMLGYDIEAAEYQRDSTLLTQKDVKLHEEMMRSAKAIAGYEQEIANAKITMHGEALDVEIDRLNMQIEGEKRLSAIRQEVIVQEDERMTDFKTGWRAAWTSYVQDSQNYGQMAGDIFGSVMGNMGSAIDNFAHTGKFAFKDFARSVIQDILAIVMKMQMMKIIMSAVGAFGGGGGVAMGEVGGASVASDAGGLFNSSFSTIPHMATGGSPDRPTLVGENGPELFIPKRSGGTIVPNSQLGSFGNQPQTVINGPYIANMSAIDTQSAVQFLSKNKQAVFAANYSAQRSLPAGR